MAKKKLTYGEMLADAMDVEKPYELPDRWIWVKLGAYIKLATDFVANGSFATLKANVNYYKEENYALMVKTQDFANNFTEKLTFTDRHGYEFLEKSVLYGGELILSNIGSIGKVFRVPFLNRPMTLASNSIMIKCFQEIDYDYLYFLFLSPMGYRLLMSISSGTAIMKFNKTGLKTLAIPIAPFAEQKRIVEEIKNMFEKLDKAKDLLQECLDEFENRRSAILHKAFTGELTKKWREENGINLDSWEESTFSESVEIKSNLVDPKDYPEFPHIAPNNIEKGTGKLLEYNTIEEDGVQSGKHRFYSGQIIYSKIRPYLSKVALVDFDGLCSADMYPIDWNYNNRFLYYYMLTSAFVDYASNAGSRSVLPKINQKELGRIFVPIPKIEEQNEIIRLLDSLLDKEDTANELLNSIDDIETMKKTILAKAFRGELGTGDENDEDAMELLKRICRERASGKIEVVKPKVTNYIIEIEKSEKKMEDVFKILVSKNGEATPDEVYKNFDLEIDEFYEQLKKYVNENKIKEITDSEGTRKLVMANEN